MFWNGDAVEQKQATDYSSLWEKHTSVCNGGLAPSGRRQSADLAVLQNVLSNQLFSLVNSSSAPAQTLDHILAQVKTGSSSSVKPAAGTSSSGKLPVKCDRYKTELCRTYEENGTCRYGDKCQFAHSAAELRTVARHPKYKTDLCRTFHTSGFCPYGSRCHFIHSLHERQPVRVPVQAHSLLMARLAVEAAQVPPVELNSLPPSPESQQSVNNLLHTLSSLLETNQLSTDYISSARSAQELDRKPPALHGSHFIQHHNALLRGVSHISDTTSVSASPCPSPTSPSHDILTPGSGSCFSVNSHLYVPVNAGFQQLAVPPADMLTPPGSPGSAASSLTSHFSDYDGSDSSWARSYWPGLLSPVKDDVSLIGDLAHGHLLTSKSSVFA